MDLHHDLRSSTMPSSLNSLRRIEEYVGQTRGVLTRPTSLQSSLCQGLLTSEQQGLMPSLNIEPATPDFSKVLKDLPEAFEACELPRTPSISSGIPSTTSWSAFSTPETERDEVYPLAAFEIKASPTIQAPNLLTTSSSPTTKSVAPLCRVPSPLRKKSEPEAGFVKRPLNSFMLYRKDHQHRFATNNHQSISRAIGDMWRKETAETKNYYDKLAKAERDRHHLEHPGYKFQPKKKKDNKSQAAAAKIPRKKRSTEIRDDARLVVPVTSADPSTSDGLTVPGSSDMRRSASQHSFQGTSLSLTSSQDSFPLYDRRESAGIPVEYSHYAGHLDFQTGAQDMQSGLVPSQPSEYFRDPQDWHQQHVQPPLLPATFSNEQRLIADWHNHEAHHDAVDCTPRRQMNDAPVLMTSTFTNMSEREYQRRLEIDCWNADMSHQSQQATDAYQTQSWQHPHSHPQCMTAEEEQDLQALDYAYALSTGFAPGTAHGSWELERHSF